MTYASARAQIVRIMKDVVPTSNLAVGEGVRFVHLAEGRSGIACRSRSFWLESNVDGDGGVTGPFTVDLQASPRMTFSLTLTVSYRLVEKRADLDVVMASDLRDYSIALLTPGLWERSTSCIHNVVASPFYLPTRRVFGADSVEQRTGLTLLFH